MPVRVPVHLHLVISEAALFVSQRTINQLLQLFDAERFESKNLRARYERAVYVKERIVRGRTDEAEISSFYVRQKNVLLRLIEMMNLIDKQDRLLPRCAEPIGGRREHAAHFGDIAFHAADSNKFCVRHLRDDVRQRRLSAAGRPVENHRGQAIGFNRATQKFARTKNVFLADKFLERARPHPSGERRVVCSLILLLFLEQVLHRRNYGALLMQAIVPRSGGLKSAAWAIWRSPVLEAPIGGQTSCGL